MQDIWILSQKKGEIMLENLKKKVVKYALQAERAGLCRPHAGNFSLKDSQTGNVCITPTGIARADLSYHDIVVINMDGKVLEAETGLRPTSETLMHLAAYSARTDMCGVAHTHSKFATSFAILKKTIPAIVYEITELGCKNGYVPVADYKRPGTKELANVIIDSLKLADVILLESHGVVSIGADLKAASLKAEYVEELAEVYYNTLLLNGGKEPKSISVAELNAWKYPEEINLCSNITS